MKKKGGRLCVYTCSYEKTSFLLGLWILENERATELFAWNSVDYKAVFVLRTPWDL